MDESGARGLNAGAGPVRDDGGVAGGRGGRRRPRPAHAGRVVFWDSGSLWLGTAVGQVPVHGHHALQLVLVPQGRARVLDAVAGQWHEGSCLLVQPGHPHALDGQGLALAVVFLAPESGEGRLLRQRVAGQPVCVLSAPPALLAGVEDLLQDTAGGGTDALAAAARALVHQLAGEDGLAGGIDTRVARVLAWLEQAVDGPVTLAAAARVAGLSPGRLRHLFVAQTGTPLRVYIRWRRLNRALARGLAGMSWTDAAQCSGFADQAHLTRTCRRMVGLVPSMLARPARAMTPGRGRD